MGAITLYELGLADPLISPGQLVNFNMRPEVQVASQLASRRTCTSGLKVMIFQQQCSAVVLVSLDGLHESIMIELMLYGRRLDSS